MFTETEARYKLLSLVNKPDKIGTVREFEIKSIRLSDRGDYWIMQANTIDPRESYAGVSGYLLDNSTGDIQVCGGWMTPEIYLEEKYDIEAAESRIYVLTCAHSSSDKDEVINFRKVFNLSPREALYFTKTKPQWFEGSKRLLRHTQNLLLKKGVRSKIELVEKSEAVAEITREPSWWTDMEKIFSEKFKI